MIKIYPSTFCLLISIIFLMCGCKKDVDSTTEDGGDNTPEEDAYNWKMHPEFRGTYMAQMNSYRANDNLYILGIANFSKIERSTSQSLGNTVFYPLSPAYPFGYRFPLSEDFIIQFNATNGLLIFTPTKTPTSGTAFAFPMESIDFTFTDFDFRFSHQSEASVINNQNQCLIPYIHVDRRDTVKFALIGLEKGAFRLDTTSVSIIKIPRQYFISYRNIFSSKEYFFVSIENKVFRIDASGNVEHVLDAEIYRFIEKEDKLIAFSAQNIYFSYDNGLSWTEGYGVAGHFRQLKYIWIDNELVAFRNGQIWKLSIDESELLVDELDNSGLEQYRITSISAFDGFVYATTFGGVFYKPISEFFN